MNNFFPKFKKPASTYSKVIFLATIIYLLLISAFMVWHRQFFSPDRFLAVAFFGTLVTGQAFVFLWDWLPPVLLILGYEYLRGLVPLLIDKVHIRAMIFFDRALFGVVPTLWLQQKFFHGSVAWYDQAAVILYFLHFVMPLLAAMLLWQIDRPLFKRYMAAMVVLSYLAFLTYYLFPAMPPWMAAQQGFLPPVAHIMQQVLANFARPLSLPTFYQYVGANLVAAVPSLHAAYPLTMALFLHKKFPRFGKISFLYPAAMWLSVVYLGEHYVFDILVAICYTLFVYAAVTDWRGYRSAAWQKCKNLFGKFKFFAANN